MKHLHRLAGCVLALSALTAQADVLYTNGNAAFDAGRCSEDSGACGGSWTTFDDFTLSSASTVTSVTWTTRLYGGLGDYGGSRAWIYDADPVFAGGNLLATISLQSGNPALSVAGEGYYDVTLSGLNIALGAGTYWLGMQNHTFGSYASSVCTENCSGNSTQWQDGGDGYRSADGHNLAFRVEGGNGNGGGNSVPEPGSLALLAGGISAFLLARRKR